MRENGRITDKRPKPPQFPGDPRRVSDVKLHHGAASGLVEQNSEASLQALLKSVEQESLTQNQAASLARYLDLLLRWNSRVNLTAIRDEKGILRRHLLESVLCARMLPDGITNLLDYGSGAGLPGIPCAVCRSDLRVTLAESQVKKAVFLREAVRVLNLNATVYCGRVEDMDSRRLFEAVTLRAVDRMPVACASAAQRLANGGWMIVFATNITLTNLMRQLPGILWREARPIAGTDRGILLLGEKVPR